MMQEAIVATDSTSIDETNATVATRSETAWKVLYSYLYYIESFRPFRLIETSSHITYQDNKASHPSDQTSWAPTR